MSVCLFTRAFRSEFIAKASTSAWHVGVECFALAALALLSGYLLGLQHAKLQVRLRTGYDSIKALQYPDAACGMDSFVVHKCTSAF